MISHHGQCAAGYYADPASLSCDEGVLMPNTFVCREGQRPGATTTTSIGTTTTTTTTTTTAATSGDTGEEVSVRGSLAVSGNFDTAKSAESYCPSIVAALAASLSVDASTVSATCTWQQRRLSRQLQDATLNAAYVIQVPASSQSSAQSIAATIQDDQF